MTTGFEDLDCKLKWQDGALIVVAARPGMGKTSLATQLVQRTCEREDVPALVITLEQGRDDMVDRMLVASSEINARSFQEGTIRADSPEITRITAAAARLGKSAIFFADEPCMTILQIASLARQHRQRYEIGLLAIDYLGLIEPDYPDAPRYEQVSRHSR